MDNYRFVNVGFVAYFCMTYIANNLLYILLGKD